MKTVTIDTEKEAELPPQLVPKDCVTKSKIQDAVVSHKHPKKSSSDYGHYGLLTLFIRCAFTDG